MLAEVFGTSKVLQCKTNGTKNFLPCENDVLEFLHCYCEMLAHTFMDYLKELTRKLWTVLGFTRRKTKHSNSRGLLLVSKKSCSPNSRADWKWWTKKCCNNGQFEIPGHWLSITKLSYKVYLRMKSSSPSLQERPKDLTVNYSP